MTRYLLLVIAAPLVLGCSPGLPAVKPPAINSQAAAQAAIAEFDSNGDQVLTQSEACIGMSSMWARYDQDADGSATADEIAARFDRWATGDTGLMNLRVEIQFRGNSLPDAHIEMTPYAFLGENVLPASGTTDSYGYAFMAIPKERLPKSQQATHGMQVGLYKVSITHPDVEIPAKYNTATELSVDLSPLEANTGVQFKLK